MASDVVQIGFQVFELADPDFPQDRHCILRPDSGWGRSEYGRRAHMLAGKAAVIQAPP